MTLRIRAKVLIHVWSYDFYDMTFYPLNNIFFNFHVPSALAVFSPNLKYFYSLSTSFKTAKSL